MKFRHTVALLTLIAVTGCSGSQRRPSSTEPDGQSVELAAKLNGGELKFRAFRDDDKVSVLGFMRLKLQNCVALVNAAADFPSHPEFDFKGSYVECQVDLDSDPIRSSFRVKIQGDKRDFQLVAYTETNNKYSLDMNVRITHENKRWRGTGKVYGWINKSLGKGTSITATVRETIEF